MSKICIADMLARASASKERTHTRENRMETVGASEVGQCIRRVAFDKKGFGYDESYKPGRGAADRGELIERHYWEPGIRANLPEDVTLLYASDHQRTLKDGYLSASPDGLLVGCARDCLAHMGIPDIGESGELLIECKSIDPRVNLEEEKAEHQFQVRQQLGLVRKCTNHQPNFALISYIDASFLDNVREFVVPYDERVFAVGRQRATAIMGATHPNELDAEGQRAGGKECNYCPWRSQCRQEVYAAVPRQERQLDEPDMIEAKRLVYAAMKERDARERAEMRHRAAQEELKEFLRDRRTRRVRGDGFSVSYSAIEGRKSLDREAMEADGIDLSQYQTAGEPSERLTISVSNNPDQPSKR